MWNPEDYAKNSDAQLKWAQELRKSLNLPDYRSILDVGCEVFQLRSLADKDNLFH